MSLAVRLLKLPSLELIKKNKKEMPNEPKAAKIVQPTYDSPPVIKFSRQRGPSIPKQEPQKIPTNFSKKSDMKTENPTSQEK